MEKIQYTPNPIDAIKLSCKYILHYTLKGRNKLKQGFFNLLIKNF